MILLDSIFLIYLFFLSIVDIRKRELEYWQTAGGYVVAVAIVGISFFSTDNRLRLLIDTFLGGIALFMFMLLTSLFLEKKGQFAFGGADIWVAGSIGLVFGLLGGWMTLCCSLAIYIVFVVAYKLFKKEKPDKLPFVPFFFLGSVVYTCLVYLL